MTRKTRPRQLRIHTAYQSGGYCAVCFRTYNSLDEHVRSKKHQKLIGDDASFISLKSFDDNQDTSLASFLAFEEINAIELNSKICNFSPPPRQRPSSKRMPRTRTASLIYDRMKDSPLSPISSDSGHHLRSRKNINYMTPPLEDDSLTEKPEVTQEYRELRSSSRLLAKLTNQIVGGDEVWNSGRPKRSCNRQRISADERLVVDNKSYYKVEVLPTKLRSGAAPFHADFERHPETPVHEVRDEKGLLVKFKKLRNSELVQLNNEAENFLFPKKDDDTSEEEDTEDDGVSDANDANDKFIKTETNSLSNDTDISPTRIKMEDDESMHSTYSDGKGKKRRRTHAEAFIMDNQKYYKFETPGSRLRYHGSYLSPLNWKTKNNGDCCPRNPKEEHRHMVQADPNFKLNVNDYNFSFESVPKKEVWFKTFQRRDRGEEKYAFVGDDNYWDPLVLPYQLDGLLPLDPKSCISQYNQIKKCLMEPISGSTSVGSSTPDPNPGSNSSSEPTFTQDEDSKISGTMTEVSSSSTLDEMKLAASPSRRKGRPVRPPLPPNSNDRNGKNPRKSPRQHASTLAILSSLIHQRKRKSRRSEANKTALSTIVEEPATNKSPKNRQRPDKIDYFTIARNFEEELATVCDHADLNKDLEVPIEDGIDFKTRIDIVDLLNLYDSTREKDTKASQKRFFSDKPPTRKPGRKRKKNLTGWPSRNRRIRRERDRVKEEDDSTIDSGSVNSEENEDLLYDEPTDSIKRKDGENNNKGDQSTLVVGRSNKAARSRVTDNKSDDAPLDKVLTDKVNSGGGGDGDGGGGGGESFNVDLQYQPYVRVQKLDRSRLGRGTQGRRRRRRRSDSPRRTNRRQRRMPASPRSPRTLRRPRGRWYRER